MVQFYKELLMPEGKYSLKRYIATKFSFLFIVLMTVKFIPRFGSIVADNLLVAIIGVITAATAATIQLTKKGESK
jgi:hypothetical protein